jgi:hypothetical protein
MYEEDDATHLEHFEDFGSVAFIPNLDHLDCNGMMLCV